MSTVIVITDTSLLINFLVLDQTALLARLPDHRFVVTEHVRAEITDHYQDQLHRLETAFTAGILEEIRVTDLAEMQLFAQLGTAPTWVFAIRRWQSIEAAGIQRRIVGANYQ